MSPSLRESLESPSLAVARDRADMARDMEREFVNSLLDAVGRALEEIEHEVARIRGEGREDDAHAVESAARPLRQVHSGVAP